MFSRSLRFTAVAGLGAAAALALGVVAPADASPVAASVTPAYSCHYDSYSHVQASSTPVRTGPGSSYRSLGSLSRGTKVTFCSSSGRLVGNIYWVYGYGNKGSTKLTGWVNQGDLNNP